MRCPGQDTRFWKPGDIFETHCPKCERTIEFFKDEVKRRCRCGHEVVNPKMDLGCAAWCQYAEQCIGTLSTEARADRKAEEKDLLRERISFEMRKFWGTDYKPVQHALRVARNAERILRIEGGNPLVVIGAAYLHGLLGDEAEPEGQSKLGRKRDEGSAIVREILDRVTVDKDATSEIIHIVDRLHRPRGEESLNFQILFEAEWVTRIEEQESQAERERLGEKIGTDFRTTTGKKRLRELLSRS